MCYAVLSLSCLTLCNHMGPCRFLCPWGLSRQEYWSVLPCPPPRDLSNEGIKPRSPKLQADFFTIWATRKASISPFLSGECNGFDEPKKARSSWESGNPLQLGDQEDPRVAVSQPWELVLFKVAKWPQNEEHVACQRGCNTTKLNNKSEH